MMKKKIISINNYINKCSQNEYVKTKKNTKNKKTKKYEK